MSTAPELDFRAIDEREPGPKWRALFEEFWPAYERWFLRDGDTARPTYAESLRAMRRDMPELLPTYERLTNLAGGGDRAARFLSLYCPPKFMTGCVQAIWLDGEFALVRNYDYLPRLCDGVILRSGWSGASVIAAVDCLWGVLDGMNEHGLVVALSFGGRPVVGDGFGVTLILRYVLETCESAREARATLARLRPHMTYNVSVLDRDGHWFQAYLAPDRPAEFTRRRIATNHQGPVEWPEYARASATLERAAWIEARLADPDASLDAITQRFLEPPLYRRDFGGVGGTLYTAVYRPGRGEVEFRWPSHAWRLGHAAFVEGVYVARYAAGEREPAESSS